MEFERGIIIRDKTRLEQLVERFNSKAQAKFYLERAGGDFSFYEQEHNKFYASLEIVKASLKSLLKVKELDRSFLPTYIFSKQDLPLVLGQDGLVANTAKYVDGLPIVAVNPDAEQYDGVLLPFVPDDLEKTLGRVMKNDYAVKQVTMAEAKLDDGQSLLAFNDLFIGASSHVSSKYEISHMGKSEEQSSSGVIVSTGAGSTGWLSSVFNMANNLNLLSGYSHDLGTHLSWDADQLIFVVREPFASKSSGINIGCGVIRKGEGLQLSSKMSSNGVIFSDGIESDFLTFNSGSNVTITVSDKKALIVA
ncbi:sugar kinase [Roseivirga pacifica]|uniref:sugar kinase n=1 Tax=Roseivirga pacifica TaxID=1267423 RepID=UPI003BB194CF